jgi:hypothetical protein
MCRRCSHAVRLVYSRPSLQFVSPGHPHSWRWTPKRAEKRRRSRHNARWYTGSGAVRSSRLRAVSGPLHGRGNVDPLLLPSLEAENEALGDDELAVLMTAHALPVMKRTRWPGISTGTLLLLPRRTTAAPRRTVRRRSSTLAAHSENGGRSCGEFRCRSDRQCSSDRRPSQFRP